MTRPHVAVIGGGFAGVAAACELADRGIAVTLLERRDRLGGRAGSFVDEESDEQVDAGQHLLCGAYRETLALLARLGQADKLVWQERLRLPLIDLRAATPRTFTFELGHKGPPWHLLAGLARFSALSLAKRAALLRVAAALQGLGPKPDDAISVLDWLTRCGQSRSAVETLWAPIAVATLNQDIRLAASDLFATVLRETLLAGPESARLCAPPIALADLLDGPVREYLIARGGEVRAPAPVRTIDAPSRLTLRDGQTLAADAVILAVAPAAVPKLLPAPLTAEAPVRDLSRLGSSPIVSVHLWIDGLPPPEREPSLLGLVGSPLHWIFAHPKRLSLVASAAYELIDREPPDIAALAWAETQPSFPTTKAARLRSSRVLKARAATIAHTVGTGRFRPGVTTPLPGLFLAGDFVDTGLPATIESAVRAGRRAAQLACAFVRSAAATRTSDGPTPRDRGPREQTRPEAT